MNGDHLPSPAALLRQALIYLGIALGTAILTISGLNARLDQVEHQVEQIGRKIDDLARKVQ